MAIELTDDGTLDTVLRCSECGEEFRFNYDPGPRDAEDAADRLQEAGGDQDKADQAAYDDYVVECIFTIEGEHDCPPNEPDDDDITTENHRTFRQNGRVVLEVYQAADAYTLWFGYERGKQFQIRTKPDDHVTALCAYMDKVQFWPNCWFISDHGNAHLMDLSE